MENRQAFLTLNVKYCSRIDSLETVGRELAVIVLAKTILGGHILRLWMEEVASRYRG
jgi:hypothetical protein